MVSNRRTSISPSLGYEINYTSSEQMELREDANIYVFMPFCVFIQMSEYSKMFEEFNVLKLEVINIVNYLPSVIFWTLLWPVFHGCACFREPGCSILQVGAVAASHSSPRASSRALVSSLQAARLLSPALVVKWATLRFQCFQASLVSS